MRHLKAGKKLSRTASHKKATMRALSVALIENRRIVTTLAKAKELRRYFEPLVTKAKKDTRHNRHQIFSFLQDKRAVTLMFDEVAAVVGDRPGGYTRIIKIGTRPGDGAETAMIELVDFNDVKPETKSKKKRKTRRGSGGGKKSIKGIKEKEDKEEAKTESKTEAKEDKKVSEVEEVKEEKKAESKTSSEEQTAETEEDNSEDDSKEVEDKKKSDTKSDDEEKE